MDFDKVLERCGNYGRFQAIVILLFGYINVLSSMHYFSQTLISFTPDHWCYHDKLVNLTYEEISNVYKSVANPSCTLLEDVVNGSAVVAKTGACKKWIYKYDNGYESVTTELNWVCEEALMSATGQSFYFVGSVIGTISFGLLADNAGRLPAIIATTLTGAFGDFITSFTYSFPTYCIARFFSGLSTDSLYYIMYIIVFEYLNPKKRSFGLNINTTVLYFAGVLISPWVALWIGTWRKYLLIVSLPALGVLAYPFLICESAHWLITKQKYERAVECLKKVAKINGRNVDESVYTELVNYYKAKNEKMEKINVQKDTFMGMFRTPRLRKFTFILMIKATIVTLTFDIMSRNMEGLGSSPFFLFSLSSLSYIPGGLTIILLQNVIGRKGLTCGSFFLGAIITAITGYTIAIVDRNENAVLLALLITIGRYGAVVINDAESQYASELIPTSVRGRGMANVHVVGYGITFFSAYVIYLGNYYKPLPSFFLSFIMCLGVILSLFLPETLNKKLPETLLEGENFALNDSICDFSFFSCNKNKKHAYDDSQS